MLLRTFINPYSLTLDSCILICDHLRIQEVLFTAPYVVLLKQEKRYQRRFSQWNISMDIIDPY